MICSRKGKKQKIVRKKKPDSSEGYVYVVTNELYKKYNIYKIGYTTNIDRRMKALSNANPFDMYPVFVFKFENNPRMERKIHKEYEMWRIKREFFYLQSYVLEDMKAEYYDYLFLDETLYFEKWQSVERLKIPFLAENNLQ